MHFENIVISPPDNYKFLNFIPIVINIHFEIRKSKNRLEVSFKEKVFRRLMYQYIGDMGIWIF